MGILTKNLRKYLLAETKKNYTKATQYSYDHKIRERAKTGIDDLTLIAEKTSGSWRKIFDDKIEKLVENILTPKEESHGEYFSDLWAYETALSLLGTLDSAFNKILNHEKISDMKRLNPNIMHRYYRNIAALEMMLIAYFEKM